MSLASPPPFLSQRFGNELNRQCCVNTRQSEIYLCSTGTCLGKCYGVGTRQLLAFIVEGWKLAYQCYIVLDSAARAMGAGDIPAPRFCLTRPIMGSIVSATFLSCCQKLGFPFELLYSRLNFFSDIVFFSDSQFFSDLCSVSDLYFFSNLNSLSDLKFFSNLGFFQTIVYFGFSFCRIVFFLQLVFSLEPKFLLKLVIF